MVQHCIIETLNTKIVTSPSKILFFKFKLWNTETHRVVDIIYITIFKVWYPVYYILGALLLSSGY